MATDYDAPRKQDEEQGEESYEELNVVVLPAQDDEFTCASCFLVRHRSQIAREDGGLYYCVECEG